MNDMNEDIISEKLNSLFPENITEESFDIAFKRLLKEKESPDFEDILSRYLDLILYTYCGDYLYYPDKLTEADIVWRSRYSSAVKHLPKTRHFYHAVEAFFQNQRMRFADILRQSIEKFYSSGGEVSMTESELVQNYVIIFKNAWPGFWTSFGGMLSRFKVDEGVADICTLLEDFYRCSNAQEALDTVLDFLPGHHELVFPKEIIANTYYDLKMWNNALAYLEQIEEAPVFMYDDTLYFMLGFCSGKCRAYRNEVEYYRKSLAANPDQGIALNNMGYSLYRQGEYTEAKKVFEECLKKELDSRYAPNNYIRLLMAMKLYKDANDFVASGKYKISKTFEDKLRSTDGKNHVFEPVTMPKPVPENEEQEAAFDDTKNQTKFSAKDGQFSNEKLLEDELNARIEAGNPVFGLDLKMWRRKGEYGRQYILPTGKRLDLLCEDKEGNIYIIELKKDSGYDDPYIQTVEYIEWFENEKRFSGKKIYGIICLNNPSKTLLDKVHKDSRVRVFEYQISYRER